MIFFIQHMRANIFISLCILSIIACTFFLFLHSQEPVSLPTKEVGHAAKIKASLSTQEIQIETIHKAAETDPIQAIALLKQFIENEPTYMNKCHETAHEIGHISYEHFGEQAFVFKDPFCGGGYLHGLLEEAAIFDETMDLTEIVHTVCSGDIEESCLHGLGHAIYKSVQDVPQAIQYCDKVRTDNKDCYDGVYMGLFDLEGTAEKMSIVEGLDICNTPDTRTRSSCLFYLPRLLKGTESESVISFCSALTAKVDQLTCAQGSGVMFMKYATVFEIEAVTQKCNLYIDKSLKQACIKGANDYYVYGNVTNTEW
jgi:hypothetical protein